TISYLDRNRSNKSQQPRNNPPYAPKTPVRNPLASSPNGRIIPASPSRHRHVVCYTKSLFCIAAGVHR
ncbi:MAG: hypothetical protein ACK2UJ_09800, partial [Candidatus Promineifilaceae bacterium]